MGDDDDEDAPPFTRTALEACNGGTIRFHNEESDWKITDSTGAPVSLGLGDDNTITAEITSPPCDVAAAQELETLLEWLKSQYAAADSDAATEAAMASSAAITASSGFTGCSELLNTFFTTKKATINMPETTDCLVDEWDDESGTMNADWVNNPCCNEAKLNSMCCNPQSGGKRLIDVIDTLEVDDMMDTCNAASFSYVRDVLSMYVTEQDPNCDAKYGMADSMYDTLTKFRDTCYTAVTNGETCTSNEECPYTAGCNKEWGHCTVAWDSLPDYLLDCYIDKMDEELLSFFKMKVGATELGPFMTANPTSTEKDYTTDLKTKFKEHLSTDNCYGSDYNMSPWITVTRSEAQCKAHDFDVCDTATDKEKCRESAGKDGICSWNGFGGQCEPVDSMDHEAGCYSQYSEGNCVSDRCSWAESGYW
jgi:hypothetical protein